MADHVATNTAAPDTDDDNKLFAEWDRSADEQILVLSLIVVVVGLIVVFGVPQIGGVLEVFGL